MLPGEMQHMLAELRGHRTAPPATTQCVTPFWHFGPPICNMPHLSGFSAPNPLRRPRTRSRWGQMRAGRASRRETGAIRWKARAHSWHMLWTAST